MNKGLWKTSRNDCESRPFCGGCAWQKKEKKKRETTIFQLNSRQSGRHVAEEAKDKKEGNDGVKNNNNKKKETEREKERADKVKILSCPMFEA